MASSSSNSTRAEKNENFSFVDFLEHHSIDSSIAPPLHQPLMTLPIIFANKNQYSNLSAGTRAELRRIYCFHGCSYAWRIIAVKWELLGGNFININSLERLFLIKCEKKLFIKDEKEEKKFETWVISSYNRKWKIITLVEIKIELISH